MGARTLPIVPGDETELIPLPVAGACNPVESYALAAKTPSPCPYSLGERDG